MREDGAVTQVRYIARSRLGVGLRDAPRQARAVSAGLTIRSGKPGNRRLAFVWPILTRSFWLMAALSNQSAASRMEGG